MPVKKQAGGTKVSERLSDGTYRVLNHNDHVIEKLLANCDNIDILSWTSLGAFLFKVKIRPGTIMLRSQVYGHLDDINDTSIPTRLTREEHEDTPENVNLGQQMHSFVIKFAFISKTSGYLDDRYTPPLKPSMILDIGFDKAKVTETEAKREASKQQFVHKKMLCWDGITPFSPDIISNEIMSSNKFRAIFSAAEIKQRNLGNLDFISVVDWIYAQLAKDPRLKVSLTVMDLVEGRTLHEESQVIRHYEYSDLCLQAVAKVIILAMKCSACPRDLHNNNLMVVSVKHFLLIKRRVNVIDYGGVLILNDSYDYDIVVSKYVEFIMTGEVITVEAVKEEEEDRAVIVPVTDLGLQQIESFFNMKNIRPTDSIDTKKTKIMRAFVAEVDFVRSFSKIENDSVLWSKVRNDNSESYSIMHRILMVMSIIDILLNRQLMCGDILYYLYRHSGYFKNDALSFYKQHNIDYNTELLTNPDLSNRFKALHKHLIETISECVLPIASGVSALVAASESALVASESPPQKIQTLAPPDLFGYLKKHPIVVGGNSNRHRRTRRRVVARRHSIKRTNKRKNKRKYKNKK